MSLRASKPLGPPAEPRYTLGDVVRELRQINQRLDAVEARPQRPPATPHRWPHSYQADEGELLILRRVLQATLKPDQQWLRNNIFRTRCTVEGKYIDSSGKDQGNSVRRKSQALVSLVNEKKKIQEVRQKALSNKDKYRPTYSSSGSYKPGSYSSGSGYGDRYDDDHYEGRSGGKDLGYRDGERDGGLVKTAVLKALSPAELQASSPQNNHHGEHHDVTRVQSSPMSMDNTSFDEFDPRGFTPAVNFAPLTTHGSGIDLFGNSSSLDPVNSLALVLSSPTTTINKTEEKTNSGFGINYVALSSAFAALSQPTEDPLGDAPFRAIPQESSPTLRRASMPVASSVSSFPPSASSMSTAEPVAPVFSMVDTSLDFGFGDLMLITSE